ncbi:hypothetical protein [Sphingobacterium thalpophilum]|uniref:hypothetical protein n=1 Tax=Sphingobacterium thalpophilum TaxID=259 RepID=UPI0031E247D2
MRKVIFLITVILCALIVKGQRKDFIPPSPEVNRLVEFQKVKTNGFQGLPDYSVPLYEITCGKLRSSISLFYYFTGFKPHETYSKVGLGWGLKSGGTISRVIRGIADEKPAGKLKLSSTINTIEELNSQSPLQEYSYLRKVIDGEADSEPDVFTYSIGERSDSFILRRVDNNVQVLTLSGDTLTKIIPLIDVTSSTSGGLNGFKIIDQDGTSYDFGEGNNIERYMYSSNGEPTTWFMNRMVDYNKIDTISFEYEQNPRLITRDDSYLPKDRIYNADSYTCVAIFNYSDLTNNQTSYHYTKYLKQIKFRGGTVDFVYNNITLQNVIVKNMFQEVVNSYTLSYVPISPNHPHSTLDQIRFLDNSTLKFTYLSCPDNYDYRNSTGYKRDWYGYYSGLGDFINESYDSNGNAMTGRRGPSPSFTSAFALSSIELPTKGMYNFVWEQNKVMKNGELVDHYGIRLKYIKYISGDNPAITEEYRYGLNENGAGELAVNISDRDLETFSLNYTGNEPHTTWRYTQSFPVDQYMPISSNYPRNIYYRHIAKYIIDTATNKNIKETYEFEFPSIFMNVDKSLYFSKYWPIIPELGFERVPGFPIFDDLIGDDFNIAQLKKKNIFDYKDGRYVLISSEKNGYVKNNKQQFQYIKVARIAEYQRLLVNGLVLSIDYEPQLVSTAHFGTAGPCITFQVPPIVYKPVTVDISNTVLDRSIKVEYYGADSVVQQSNYSYIGPRLRGTVSSEVEEYSASRFLRTKTTNYAIKNHSQYPLLVTENAIQNNYGQLLTQFNQGNFYPKLSESKFTFVNDGTEARMRSTNSSDVTEYGYFNTKVFPKYHYKLFDVANSMTSEYYVKRTEITEYTVYDKYGNPVEIKEQDGKLTTYIWGYKGKYPIAKIDNASYSQVFGIIGQSTIDQLNSTNITDNLVMNVVKLLRSQLSNVEITGFTYKHLVGLTGIIDNNLKKREFRYDSTGRLEGMVDFEGSWLEQYKYNYKH